MYIFPEPPYFLLVAGLFVSVASGAAFEAFLKQSVQLWSKTKSSQALDNLRGMQLFLPFLGMSLGVCLFLSSGLEIFGFPTLLSYQVSIPLTVFISWLVWRQLGKILIQLEQGGSRAIDLDALD